MDNRTIMQYFEWYLPSDGLLWGKAASQAGELANVGITDVWLPPAYKGATGAKSIGYDVYDLYDLGEFDQKGSVRTKYGTRKEYLSAVQALHNAGVSVIADTVLNQMMGADETEKVEAIETAANNREMEISGLHEIEAWTKFTFPGRKGKYCSRIWTAENFTGTDRDVATGSEGVYLFRGKQWNDETDSENVNYDYLMGVNLDFDNPETCQALLDWGKWYFDTVQPDGLRLDAVKHISFASYREWLKLIRRETGKDFFAVGEYWSGDVNKLLHYINVVVDGDPTPLPEKKAEADPEDPEAKAGQTDPEAKAGQTDPEAKHDTADPETEVSREAHRIADAGTQEQPKKHVAGTQIALFDVPLHFAFLQAATTGESYDMRTLFDRTLVQARPECAVTFVDNHDTQPGQALESYIPEWFKPIAYAMILLRDTGTPCVFYGDYYGLEQNNVSPILDLKKLIAIRSRYAYGTQKDYFDDCDIVGFTRSGDGEHPDSGLAVLATDSAEGKKYMQIDPKFAGQNVYDVLGRHDDPIRLDETGGAEFHVHGGFVSVWLPENAYRFIRTTF